MTSARTAFNAASSEVANSIGRCSMRPEELTTMTSARSADNSTTSTCRIVAEFTTGYWTIATCRVICASNRTVRRTMSSTSSAPAMNVEMARFSAGLSGLTCPSRSTNRR